MILGIIIVYVIGVFVTPFLLGLAKSDPDLILSGAMFWPITLVFVLLGMAYAIGERVADWGSDVFR